MHLADAFIQNGLSQSKQYLWYTVPGLLDKIRKKAREEEKMEKRKKCIGLI